MIHVGKNTRSRIVSKGISAGQSRNCYRGLVQVQPSAKGARNYSQCDSMLIGDRAGANTYPYIQVWARMHTCMRVAYCVFLLCPTPAELLMQLLMVAVASLVFTLTCCHCAQCCRCQPPFFATHLAWLFLDPYHYICVCTVCASAGA